MPENVVTEVYAGRSASDEGIILKLLLGNTQHADFKLNRDIAIKLIEAIYVALDRSEDLSIRDTH